MNEMSWKEDYIAKHGEAGYERRLAQVNNWIETHPEERKRYIRDQNRKGGKHYERRLVANKTGLQGKRNKIRTKHRGKWQPYKRIIAPDSQLHHQWISGTSDYTGLALVEKDAHRYGRIDVIQILEGEITFLTEKEIREQI